MEKMMVEMIDKGDEKIGKVEIKDKLKKEKKGKEEEDMGDVGWINMKNRWFWNEGYVLRC